MMEVMCEEVSYRSAIPVVSYISYSDIYIKKQGGSFKVYNVNTDAFLGYVDEKTAMDFIASMESWKEC